jgi:hypothetical protein
VKFSLPAFIVTVAVVIISGVASFIEGTLTNKKVTMGFLNHGGMWGDLIIMSVVTGLAFPYFVRSRILVLSSLFIALVVTIIAHVQWAKSFRHDGITGHMFPTYETGIWYLDISGAGWMHVLLMAMLLMVILMYAVSPLPVNVLVAVSLLLTAHVFLATVQPGWYCTGELWTWRNFGAPLFVTILIWSIAILKIKLAKGSS